MVIPFIEEINNVIDQIVKNYSPKKIYLFGSCANGRAKKDSDIDLCIIMDFENKRSTRQKLIMDIECDRDVDFILYTESQWEEYVKDTTTFANLIYRTGVEIYG